MSFYVYSDISSVALNGDNFKYKSLINLEFFAFLMMNHLEKDEVELIYSANNRIVTQKFKRNKGGASSVSSVNKIIYKNSNILCY